MATIHASLYNTQIIQVVNCYCVFIALGRVQVMITIFIADLVKHIIVFSISLVIINNTIL